MPQRSLIPLFLSVTILATGLGWNDPLDARRQQGAPRPGFPTAPPRDRPVLDTATATLRGRVTRADTGEPLRGAQITVTGGRRTAQSGQRPQRWSASTDADGYYELTDLPPGRYSLSARKGSFVSLQYGQSRVGEPGTPIELAADDVLDDLDFRLPRGSVVTGRIFDEFSEPLTGVFVTALTQRYVQGRREFSPVGRGAASDDRGQYRVYGLPPGQYRVSAALRGGPQSVDGQGYAPTYYPGTSDVAQAQRVSVGLGQELTGIDYILVPVRTASVSGTATDAQGRPFANAMIMVTVDGADITGLRLAATLGATVRGMVVTENGGMPSFSPSRVQVTTQPVDFNQFRMPRPGRVNDDWTFEVEGLTDNDLIRLTGLPPEWGLKAVLFRGVDARDRALTTTELSGSGELGVVVTDRLTHLSGSVTDAQGAPALDYTVVVFPEAQDR